ncbi:DUF2235 domain-containing protein [Bradyrhizobium sp. Cp5.3]|uniref:phospholipase effector Tle1 domain-containing protein n=1 Tax=Bradyrhizobium sp. Cp5.3 TaxID=443598 RepID=UPI000554FB41
MTKNIVVYSDGTGQDGGVCPEQRVSNVYKMYHASRTGPDNPIDPQEQVAFYDPGLGTDIGATTLTAPWRFIQKLLGSVVGNGIVKNIADCYAFIINHYEPGDRVFLIGFSRGAYTVRCSCCAGCRPSTPTGRLMRFRKHRRHPPLHAQRAAVALWRSRQLRETGPPALQPKATRLVRLVDRLSTKAAAPAVTLLVPILAAWPRKESSVHGSRERGSSRASIAFPKNGVSSESTGLEVGSWLAPRNATIARSNECRSLKL